MADPAANNQDMNPEESQKKIKINKPKKSQKAQKEAFETFADDIETVVNEDAIDIGDINIDIDGKADDGVKTIQENKEDSSENIIKVESKKEKIIEKNTTNKVEKTLQKNIAETTKGKTIMKDISKPKPNPNKTQNDIGDIHSYIAAQKAKSEEENKNKPSKSRNSKEYKNTLTNTALQAQDGTDLSKLPDTYAVVPHEKGDHKIVYTKDNMPKNLWNDLKHRSKGGAYVKNGHKIYDVYADFYRHPTLKNKNGEHLQVRVVDDQSDLDNQLKAIREGKGGGTNFADPVIIQSKEDNKLQQDQQIKQKKLDTKEKKVIENEEKQEKIDAAKTMEVEAKVEKEKRDVDEKKIAQEKTQQEEREAKQKKIAEEKTQQEVEEKKREEEEKKEKSAREEEERLALEKKQAEEDEKIEQETFNTQQTEENTIKDIKTVNTDNNLEINLSDIDLPGEINIETTAVPDTDISGDDSTIVTSKTDALDENKDEDKPINLDQGSLTDIDIGAIAEDDNEEDGLPEVSFGKETSTPIESNQDTTTQQKKVDSQENIIQVEDLMQKEDIDDDELTIPTIIPEEKTNHEFSTQEGVEKTNHDLEIDISALGENTEENVIDDIDAITQDTSTDSSDTPVDLDPFMEAKNEELIPVIEQTDTINLDDLDFASNESIDKQNTDQDIYTEIDIPAPVSQIDLEIPKMIAQTEAVEEVESEAQDDQIRVNEIVPELIADKSYDNSIEKDLMPAMKTQDMHISQPDISTSVETNFADDDDSDEREEGFLAHISASQKKRILRGLIGLMFIVLLFVARAIFKFISARSNIDSDQIDVGNTEIEKLSDLTGEKDSESKIPENEIDEKGQEQQDPGTEVPDSSDTQDTNDDIYTPAYREDLVAKMIAQKSQLRTLLNKSNLVENFQAKRLANAAYTKVSDAVRDIEANDSAYTTPDLEEITIRLDQYTTSIENYLATSLPPASNNQVNE